MKKKGINIENKRAYFDYFIEEKLECGIELRGNEVKSIKDGKVSIKESWIAIENRQMFIKKMYIKSWGTSNKFDVDENRDKRLLAHRSEIVKFESKVQKQGYTLVPLKVYIDDRGKVKVLIGLCKGKHLYDKRKCERDKQVKMDIAKALKKV